MFEYNGQQYSATQINAAASKSGMSVEDYIKANNITTAKTSPTNQSAFVEPVTALNTGFNSGRS